MTTLETTVQAQDVRYSLNNISSGLLADDTITQAIVEAALAVNLEKGDPCGQQLFDVAVRAKAAQLSFAAYVIHQEMTAGEEFEGMDEIERKLEEKALYWIGFAARGTVTPGAPAVMADPADETQTLLDWDGPEGNIKNALDVD